MVSNVQFELSSLIVFVISVIFFAGGFFAVVNYRLKQLNNFKQDISEIRKELFNISQRLAKIEGLIGGVGNEGFEN